MFSEYASRFLAQSQSRMSYFQGQIPDNDDNRSRSRNPNDGLRRPRGPPVSRGVQSRLGIGNPYLPSASQMNFPFGSRASREPAPLFYSATDHFREDDEAEHERETADFAALQKSRKHFGAGRLQESSEADEDGIDTSTESSDGRGFDGRGYEQGRGIKSSWRGDRSRMTGKRKGVESIVEEPPRMLASHASSRTRPMYDVGLESAIMGDRDDPPDDVLVEVPQEDEDEPAFQQFRQSPDSRTDENAAFLQQEPSIAGTDILRRASEAENVSPEVALYQERPRHDPFWASLALIDIAAMFSTWFLVWLHTSTPSSKRPLGDTIYSTLHSSYHLLAVDTVIAVIISLLWLVALRSFVKQLVLAIIFAVPIILFSFFLYPLISSFKGSWKGASAQDTAMRWLSFVPLVATGLWVYTVIRGRRALSKAIDILEFASRILGANPALIVLGFGTLIGVIVWTWVWTAMFTRVFLSGHFSSSKNLFIIDSSSWWLGACFVFNYLWLLSIGSGIQRATTAATVSQWYFHRNTVPAPTSQQVVRAALSHSVTTAFGTICYSTLLSLLIRVPFLLLPRRATAFLGLFTYSLVPTSITALTNPLTLTYAAIHSQPLAPSARAIGQMRFLAPASATTTLNPRTFTASPNSSAPLLPYRLAKLILHATRFLMSLTLGFGGWVSTARLLVLEGGKVGYRGSMYAYIVGLIAGAIGWGILGAMEGVLGGIVDAVIVCWGSEGRGDGKGRGGGYCLEAGVLFGGEESW